jgi:hypothetical protein
MLTPRLVLTARHCVSTTDPGAECDARGNPVVGGAVIADNVPAAMYVFGGRERPDFLAGTAHPSRGQEILTTNAKTLCNNDLALILLDQPVVGAKIAPVRLDGPPIKGELVTVVGWGITDVDPNPPTRRQRTGVAILDVGPADTLGPAEFRVGEGTCAGDSGGPALAASGAVLGALSRGGNGTPSQGVDACLGGTNIFSSLAPHADFLRAGYAKAGQDPWLEGNPNPLLAKVSGACASDGDCQSNLCDPTSKTCMQACDTSPCPSAFVCGDQNGKRVCLPTKERAHGCALTAWESPVASAPASSWFDASAVAVLFACVRRKKTARSKT